MLFDKKALSKPRGFAHIERDGAAAYLKDALFPPVSKEADPLGYLRNILRRGAAASSDQRCPGFVPATGGAAKAALLPLPVPGLISGIIAFPGVGVHRRRLILDTLYLADQGGGVLRRSTVDADGRKVLPAAV